MIARRCLPEGNCLDRYLGGMHFWELERSKSDLDESSDLAIIQVIW